MIKAMRYLKKFWWAILIVVGLLYTQAQCELALPDYMSDIVTNGIQAGGIDSSVPEVLSKDTMEKALLFMDSEENKFVQSNYTLTSDKEKLPYEIKEEELEKGVYVLNSIQDEEYERLEKDFSESLLIVSSVNALENGDVALDDSAKEMMNQLPAGMSVFDAFKMMNEDQILEFRKGVSDKFSSLGEATLTLAGAQSIKAEYEMLEVDTSNIQSNYIFKAGIKMLAISLGGVFCAIIVGYFSSYIAAGVSRDMRKDVFEKVESFSNTEYNKFSTASLITRTTNDVQQIQMALIMSLRFVIYSPIMGIGAILRVMDTETNMIWIIALVVILIMSIIATLFMVVSPKFKKIQKLIDKINLVMRESLSGMLVIRAFHTEKIEEERFENANTDLLKVNLFTGKSMTLMMPIIMFIMNSASLLIVWVGSHQVDLGTMQIGDMMAFIQYAMQIIMSFMFIAMISIMLPRAGVAAKRVFEVLDMPLSIADPNNPVSFDETKKGSVVFKNVSFRYPGAEEDVLCDINFEAKPGETTAFIGSTGSGKSTIINLVPRFFDVTEGSVEVDGVDVRHVTQHDLREKIGLVPQKGVLFQGTIASNIKYSNENMSDEDMKEASVIAQAMEFIKSKEDTFDSEIAQGGHNVSGGQKQRLSIARAIAKKPEIFIFDDSFSALDFKTDAKLREALANLCKKTQSTVLLVGQRIASIMNADQIIVLDEGKMVGKGTHKELLETCDVYKEIAYSQLSKEELENE